jgi:hypothetical protein
MNLNPRSPIPTPTLTTPTVHAPTRRGALRGLFATAVGLVAAPRLPAATAVPARSQTTADYDDGDERLTPALARLKIEGQTILLPTAWELSNALAATLELHYGESGDNECDGLECEWCEDCDGLWYTVDGFVAMTWGEVAHPLYGNLEAERALRKKAFKDGKTHCGCPVAWAESALDRLQDDLKKVVVAHEQANGSDTQMATDARYFLWQLKNLRCGFDNQSGVRMSEAARDAWRRNPETLREAKALLAKMQS